MAVPKHYLYASDNATLVYTIEDVIRRDPPITLNVPNFVELSNLRSQGLIIIPAGNQAFNITITARLGGANYTALMTALTSLESTIALNTNYILKFDKSLVNNGDLESIKVTRLQPIIIDTSRGNLRTFLYYTLILKVNTWA